MRDGRRSLARAANAREFRTNVRGAATLFFVRHLRKERIKSELIEAS